MAALILRVVRTSEDLDTVELRNGVLHYRTGRARPLFEGRRTAKPGVTLSDADLFRVLSGWSNGYTQLIAA